MSIGERNDERQALARSEALAEDPADNAELAEALWALVAAARGVRSELAMIRRSVEKGADGVVGLKRCYEIASKLLDGPPSTKETP